MVVLFFFWGGGGSLFDPWFYCILEKSQKRKLVNNYQVPWWQTKVKSEIIIHFLLQTLISRHNSRLWVVEENKNSRTQFCGHIDLEADSL